MVRYCHNCGTKIGDHEHFCSNCGEKAIDLDESILNQKWEEELSKSNAKSASFEGPFGDDGRDFNGPFGDDGRDFNGPFNAESNKNNSSSSSAANNASNSPPPKSVSNGSSDTKDFLKICCGVFIVLLAVSFIVTLATHGMNDNDNDDSTYDSYGNYTIDIDGYAYLQGAGKSKLVDSNYSYLGGNDYEFDSSHYKTYLISLGNDEWYKLTVTTLKYSTPSDDDYYMPTWENETGTPYILYAREGSYDAYLITLDDSSDSSKYTKLEFLESIFYDNSKYKFSNSLAGFKMFILF